MKKIGDTITWKDVNGREHQGQVEEIISVCYKVRMENGMVMRVSRNGKEDK